MIWKEKNNTPMKIQDKIIVVTGGANGIGRALCRRFAAEKAGAVVIADIDEQGARDAASETGGIPFRADVRSEQDIKNIVAETEKRFGRIDIFCSNAGILSIDEPGGTAASCGNDIWQKSWEVHVMAHVYAARAVLPGMIKRKDGYIVNMVSAAGLLSQIGSAPYSATKHAAIGFAESLAITHGDDGIKVSVICPQAVRTGMLRGNEDGSASIDGVLEPEEVAESVILGIDEEKFLILPHREVREYMQRKTMDYDRWLKGMRRFRQGIINAK